MSQKDKAEPATLMIPSASDENLTSRKRSASISTTPKPASKDAKPERAVASLATQSAPASPATPAGGDELTPRRGRKSFRLSFANPRKKNSESSASDEPGTPKKSDDKAAASAAAEVPAASKSKKKTVGKWIKVLGDNGRTPFLPFPGLKPKAVPEPLLMHFRPGDLMMVCSDGVMAAFDKATNPQLPPIAKDMFVARDSVHRICQYVA